jgi:hypothetical protein
MQVSDLLGLMANLSVGLDNTTPTERAIFLQYLNLAHFELYQETASFNQDLIIQEEHDTQEDNKNLIKLNNLPYTMNTVYDLTHKKVLERVSRIDLLGEDPGLTATGYPQKYLIRKQYLELYPVQTDVTQVSIWYIPQPTLLKENTEESDIPYPPAYHPVLVDGGLYYLFQEEGGFKNTTKENDARARWLAGKKMLLSYLYNSSGQSISTFQSA